MGMQQLGLSLNMTMRIYKLYGENCVEIVRRNPYKLIDDIENIGFKTADKIAAEAGFERESTFRICAGIKYALSFAASEGNTCLPLDTLVMFAANNVLGIDHETVSAVTENMILNNELARKQIDGTEYVFLKSMHFLELDSAVLLSGIIDSVAPMPLFDIDDAISKLEKKFGAKLASAQRDAVKTSMTEGVLVVTGGPGTGKTTILRFIIDLLESQAMEYELAAPTGRAAKRITDTTGREARTIHRLLEYNAQTEKFNHDEDYPLETDAIIVDEMSMVDIPLFHSLLKAISPGTRLIMVGDVDQLPSVGPGNVLKDVVSSNVIPVIRLNEIFRQAGRSRIVTNAHLVNGGRMPVLDREEDDFQFYDCPTVDVALNSVLNLAGDYAFLGKSNELQVLSPMKSNLLGVFNLNARLQQELNPPSVRKHEVSFSDTVFREGDRVMQIRNDYSLTWTKDGRDGMGVFNGDIGAVEGIDADAEAMTVLFDDRRAVYEFSMLDELEHAYAVTVHKSQGSEYPIVILPIADCPPMLRTRNLLYTAVTRAARMAILVGRRGVLAEMVQNERHALRMTNLAACLREACAP